MRPRTARALVLVFAVAWPTAVAAQATRACPDRGGADVDLGIHALRCIGPSAACAINLEDQDGRLVHRFSVEPVIDSLSEPGIQSGFRKDDVLVALDGLLITTLEGGRLMANPRAGELQVLVRRAGELVELTVDALPGCGVRALSVRPGGR